MSAQSLWIIRKNHVEIREETLPPLKKHDVEVKMLYSGISRGTERLVLNGILPTKDRTFMHCPNMQGSFPFPVKYGYCAVGIVTKGNEKLIGKPIFTLHPHQTQFQVSENSVTLIPDNIPVKRAILLANMETALNAVWDAQVTIGQKIVIVGAGVVGLLIGYLCANILGSETWLIDINQNRKVLAQKLGCNFQKPLDSPDDADVVFHTSATHQGLACALSSAGQEAKIIEISWYGDNEPNVPLGAAFHPKRLQLISSQVGHIAPNMRPRHDYASRLQLAMQLLDNPILDELINVETPFTALEKSYTELLNNPETLAACVSYS